MTDKDRDERHHVADSGYEVEVVAKLTGLSRLQALTGLRSTAETGQISFGKPSCLKIAKLSAKQLSGTALGEKECHLPRDEELRLRDPALD